MITFRKYFHSVAELMEDQGMDEAELIESTGLDDRVVSAIVHQRYTPSPEQRDCVSQVLGVSRDQIKWGHLAAVEPHIHELA